MAGDRLLAIFELMTQHERAHPYDKTLCMVSAEIVGVDGAGIFLPAEGVLTPWCSNERPANDLMDLEVLFQEGPGTDAATSGCISENHDLAHSSEWTFYASEAVKLGTHSVCGFPVHAGLDALGALVLSDEDPVPLSDAQMADGYLLASIIGRAVLAANSATTEGAAGRELGESLVLDYVIHQAAGMVSVQATLPLDVALVTIQSHAFTIGITPRALARQIVDRRIRFDSQSKEWKSG